MSAEDEAPVELPITGELDLHAFAPADVASVVEEYLRVCREKKIRHVRIVHGRGKGVQRAVVRRLLARLAGVAGVADAPPGRGGWGATIVELEPERESRGA